VAPWSQGQPGLQHIDTNTIPDVYVQTILERFNLTDAKSTTIPMDVGTILSTEHSPSTLKDHADMRDIPYQRAVGSLMYAATTHPNIVFPVTMLSQFMRNPGRAYWKASKYVMKYLKGTAHYGLTLGTTGGGLEAHVDADWASQPHQHSMSRYIVLLNGGPIAWSAHC
jgi:hypothetical protein